MGRVRRKGEAQKTETEARHVHLTYVAASRSATRRRKHHGDWYLRNCNLSAWYRGMVPVTWYLLPAWLQKVKEKKKEKKEKS